MSVGKLKTSAAAILLVPLLALTGCAGDSAEEERVATATPGQIGSKQRFAEVKDVAPVSPATLKDAQKDPGLNATMIFQGASQAPNTGKAVLTVLVRNDNELPLAPDSLGIPTLRVKTSSGATEEIDLVPDRTSGIKSGLDLPLGSQAATNVMYAFDINLWSNYESARFQLGNVFWEGPILAQT